MSKLFSHLNLALMILMLPLLASAATVEELIANNNLIVEVKLLNEGTVIVKQPVRISVELLTDRWFGSGNRIHDFDVMNMVKLPFDELATNSSVRRDGKQWASQLREITLYPMQEGIYDLPPLTLDVAVNTPTGIVEGQVITDAISVTASLPDELKGVDEFVVSDDFEITVEGSFESDKEYKIGEAVTLTINMQGSGVPAMLLPVIPDMNIPGISIYRKKPQISDKTVRGELTSRRVEQLNFIFEQQGSYTLPEMEFYWWNTNDNSLEIISIPFQSWKVSDKVVSNLTDSKLSDLTSISANDWLGLLKLVIIFTLFIALLVYIIKNRHKLVSRFKRLTQYQKRQLIAKYAKAIDDGHYDKACQYLYELIPYSTNNVEISANRYEARMLLYVYGYNEEKSGIVRKLLATGFSDSVDKVSRQQALSLVLDRKKITKHSSTSGLNARIRINP